MCVWEQWHTLPLKWNGREGGGGGRRFITTTPEVVMAHILQWQPTGPWDGRNRKSCQERKRRKTHRDQKCVSVSIATHRQSQQPGAPGVIKQREKGVKWGWPHRHSLQRGEKSEERKKKDTWMIPRTTDINLTRVINASWQTRGEVIPVCSAVWSHWGKTLSFWWTRWLRDLKYFAVDKHSAHYMHLHHAGVSHRQ